jgi:hypothetical protein
MIMHPPASGDKVRERAEPAYRASFLLGNSALVVNRPCVNGHETLRLFAAGVFASPLDQSSVSGSQLTMNKGGKDLRRPDDATVAAASSSGA